MTPEREKISNNFFAVLFNGISNIGVAQYMGFKEVLRLRIFNEITAILALFLGILFLISLMNNNHIFYGILGFSLPLCGLIASKFGKYQLAYSVVSLFLPVYCVSSMLLFGEKLGAEVYIIPILASSAVFYDSKRLIMSNLIFVAVIFAVGIYGMYSIENPYAVDVNYGNRIANITVAGIISLWFFIRHSEGIANRQLELEKRNAEINEINEELKILNHQNSFKTRLLGLVAHDLRGPMAAFKNISRILNNYITKQQYDKLLMMGNYFEDASHKLFLSLDNLLNWAISQNDNIKVNQTMFYLYDIVEDAKMDADQQLRAKHIDMYTRVDQNIMVESDSSILRIITRNLIENAAKYSPKASLVSVVLEEDTDALVLKITDQGNGIDEALVKQLAAGVNVASSIKSNSHGLGLQLCFHFAALLKIEIHFKNLNGEGTEAAIKFPKENIPTKRSTRKLREIRVKNTPVIGKN